MVNPVSGLRMRVDVAARSRVGSQEAARSGRSSGSSRSRYSIGWMRHPRIGRTAVSTGSSIHSRRQFRRAGSATHSRFFLIFEARSRNASPQKIGFEGCRATANFWRSLTDENDAKKRAELLEQFYYTGIAGASGPVVQAKNYGGPLGQVRGNIFMNSAAHQEMAIARVDRGQFRPTDAGELRAGHGQGQSPRSVLSRYQWARWDPTMHRWILSKKRPNGRSSRTSFSTRPWRDCSIRMSSAISSRPGSPDTRRNSIRQTLRSIPKNIASKCLTASAPALRTVSTNFRAFRRATKTIHRAKAGPTLKNKLGTALGQFVIDAQQKPDVNQVLNRAGAVSCGGCHQFTADQPVAMIKGQAVFWPKSAGFVHVTETGGLSEALNTILLPFRQDRFAEAALHPRSRQSTVDGPKCRDHAGSCAAIALEVLGGGGPRRKGSRTPGTRTREAVQAITVERQEEIQKRGYFVIDRRPH